MLSPIIIGTRGSALALRQADIARRSLLVVTPSLQIELKVIKTEGDVNSAPIPLDVVGKGWFTKEIERELFDGTISLAVHSLKDMAEQMPWGLTIRAYLPREDARDVLITKRGESWDALPHGAIVGTDSSRRQCQMQALRPDVRMESLRGNVVRRLEKLASEDYDAIILAAAGLNRLNLQERIAHYFDAHEMTPAPGQGILAVQMRESDAELGALVAAINDADAERVAEIERAFSYALGGGCKSPVGAYAFRDGEQCRLIGMAVDPVGTILRTEASAPWDKSAQLGETLARTLKHGREHV